MEQLPALGTAIPEVAPKTIAIYESLLVENAAPISSTPRKTFQYGPHSRQHLDVYYPSSSPVNTAASDGPILIFLYGGGLARGDKILPLTKARGLVHANVGHFFAESYGFTTVVPDYRLISHGAKYPSGGEDVALAVAWVVKNLATDASRPRDLFIMGNSAGGIHLSTYLFAPQFEESRRSILTGTETSLVLKGAVMLSVPFHFRQALQLRADTLQAYYGDEIDEHSPDGLLRGLVDRIREDDDGVLSRVNLLVLNGSLDPDDEILLPRRDFLETWDKIPFARLRGNLLVEMMEGQNHISPPLSLGTKKENEEAWGHQVGRWIESVK